jgi:hypothetical protein
VITIIGLVSIVYTWIKQKNLFKKIVYSASIYFFSFYSASYFNPTIIAFSAYGMFSSWVVGLYGEAVKTKYADDFHWENFLKIQKKEPLNKVESLIGKPMNSYLDGNGNMLRIYSTNDRTWELTDDYWHIEVKYDKNEKVMGANLSYYFD